MRSGLPKDDLVTGEAVVVALPFAGLAIRALSGAVDMFVHLLLTVGLTFGFVRVAGGLDDALVTSFSLLITVFCLVGFPVICESLTGRTVGKKLTGLRTVRNDGGPADPRRIVTRHLIGVVEIWLTGGVPALITGLLTEPTRRLGDIAAGTYVARDRVRLELPPPPEMPAPLQAWARIADLGRIPDELAILVRTTMAQQADFTGASGERIEQMLASRVAEHVSPDPPRGTTARAFLQAVMAERRRRETDRLEGQQTRRRRLFGGVAGTDRPTAQVSP
ncbi:RDD family protein [Mobilicoccus caccae]|nr:RDD family protein [Mobilicoccus caccae]